MRQIFSVAYIFYILCFLATSLCVADSPNYAPGDVIVKLNSQNLKQVNEFINRIGAYSYKQVINTHDSYLSSIYRLKFSPNADILSIIQRCKNDPIVEYAQPNYIYHVCAKLNDFFYPDQWALEKIKIPEAWEIEKGSEDITIAVIDTGVDYNHEDLKPRIWINKGEIPNNNIDDDKNGYIDDVRGWNFFDSPDDIRNLGQIGGNNDPMDESGHGTNVSGIIAAIPDNSVGVAGITWGCKIMPLKAGNKFFEDDDLACAIVYAVENGARIINMSWGGDEQSYVIRDVIQYAYDRNCVLVGAIGNDNQSKIIYPAAYKNVISVGATDSQDQKSSFSNYGTGIDIVAPGTRIFSTVPKNSYSDWSGTSMATPVVSGVIALVLSKRPGLTNTEVDQILRASSDTIDDPLFDGIGRVNAYRALLTVSPLNAHITTPSSYDSADNEFVITGAIGGSGFKRFELDYSEVSDSPEWRLINPPSIETKADNISASWDVSHIPEGSYILRLSVFGQDNLKAEDRVQINIDHSPPKILKLRNTTRLYGDKARNIITLKTDDLTNIELYYKKPSDKEFGKISSQSLAKYHEAYIPDNIEPGIYEYFLKITNNAELLTINDNDGIYYTIEILPNFISSDGFTEIDTGIPAIYPISASADFDGDGGNEIIGMDRPVVDYAPVRIFERDEFGNYSDVFKVSIDYFPHDVGDSDRDGLLEILGNRKDKTFLFESSAKGTYPTRKIWESSDLWGGQFADLDMDGNIEILSSNVKDLSVDVYENRGYNSYLRVSKLINPTQGINNLAINFAVGDFDTDGRKEIAIGDVDGDIFIYKSIDDDTYVHVWSGNIPDSQVKWLASGDFDGDGNTEFVVAGAVTEPSGSVNPSFVYTVFDWLQGQYQNVYSIEVIGTKEGCGLSTGDVNADGVDEIVANVSTELYILRLPMAKYNAYLWYHSASQTQHPLVDDMDGDGLHEVIFNVDNKLMAFKFDGKATKPPWGVSAVPINEHEVELRWNGSEDSIAYKIYRGIDERNLQLIATLDLTSVQKRTNWEVYRRSDHADIAYFRDNGLTINSKYFYSVSSVNSLGQERKSSNVHATPNSSPEIISAEYIYPFLYINFSEQMGQSAKGADHYVITSTEGDKFFPSSAILDQQEKRVILTFMTLAEGGYKLIVSGIRDATGVLISDKVNSVEFHIYTDKTNYMDLNLAKVYPNPVLERHKGVKFYFLPSGAKVRIYDLSGNSVTTLKVMDSEHEVIWYLDNAVNVDVSSGIYLYAIEFESKRKLGKIAVIR
jgi:subtilisin family serine protease